MELVKVTNKDKKRDLILRNDLDGDITIPPGKEQIVPVKYAVLAFGNPNAQNKGADKQRDVEYKKVRVRWGWYEGVDQGHSWEDISPKFEVHDMDGERIYMLIEDPKGEKGSKANLNLIDDRSAAHVAQRIDELEGQLAKLTTLLARQLGDEAPVPEASSTTPESTFNPAEDAQAIAAAAAAQEGQEERNEAREALPAAKPSKVKKDGPGTTRVGSAK